MLRRIGLLGIGGLLALIASGCNVTRITMDMIDLENYDKSESTTYEVPYSGQPIRVENPLGRIVVQSAKEPGYVAVRPFVRVEAVKKVRKLELKKIKVIIEADEGEIRIRTELPGRMGRLAQLIPLRIEEVGWVEYVLVIPQGARVFLDQGAGFIKISRFQGELEASTDLGEISVDDSAFTRLKLESDAGSLTVTNSSADQLQLSTDLGEVHLIDVAFSSGKLSSDAGSIALFGVEGDELRASTELGAITLSKGRLRGFHLETEAGSVELVGVAFEQGGVNTELGGIRVRLPAESSVLVDARTQFGKIRLRGVKGDSKEIQARWGGAWPGKRLTLLLKDGKSRLELTTELGGIEIELELEREG